MKKRFLSFRYAFKGIAFLFRSQPNAWIHLVATAGVIVAGILLHLSTTEWLLIAFAVGFVFSAELFNTAIEELVNLVSPEFHKKAGKIKDLAAGAVLVAAITAVIIGLVVFAPKVLQL